MSIEQKSRIDWPRTSRQLAQIVWGIGTYLAVLIAIGWGAVTFGGNNPSSVAFLAVFNTVWVHWMIFTTIERKSNN